MDPVTDFLIRSKLETDDAMHVIFSSQKDIRKYCFSLKSKVDSQSDTMIAQIRKWNEEQKEKIKKYERER